MVRQPSGATYQCEYDNTVGFPLAPLGKPQPAFGWALCASHALMLQGTVQEVIREDIADQARKMGRVPRDRS